MSNLEHPQGQSGGFNAHNLLRLISDQRQHNSEQSDMYSSSTLTGSIPPSSASATSADDETRRGQNNTTGPDMGTNCRQELVHTSHQQPRQSQQSQQIQQQEQIEQQRQAKSHLSDCEREQLVSLALSGDVNKILQLVGSVQHQTEYNNVQQSERNTSIALANSVGSSDGLIQSMQHNLRMKNYGQPTGTLGLQQQPSHQSQQQLSTQTIQQRNSSSSSSIIAEITGAAERRKKESPRTQAVPCRARGMPIEHNFKTACFVIPDTIKHRDDLICSFPSCRDQGVKFLYCAFCRGPVAKRNFRNRHSHDDEQKKEKTGNEKKKTIVGKITPVATPSVQATPRPTQRLTQRPAPRAVPRPAPPSFKPNEDTGSNNEDTAENRVSSSSSHQTSEVASLSDSTPGQDPQGPSAGKRRLDDSETTDKSSSNDDDDERSKRARVDPREKIWVSLLRNRPITDAGDDMSAWLMQVMAVSDHRKSLSEISSYRHAPFNHQERKPTYPSTDEVSFKSSSVEGDTNDSSTYNGGMNGSTESAHPSESLSSTTPGGSSSNDSSDGSSVDQRDDSRRPEASPSATPTGNSSSNDSASDSAGEN